LFPGGERFLAIERAGQIDDARSAPQSFSQEAGGYRQFFLGRRHRAHDPELQIAKDVSLLQADYAAIRTILSGVWKISCKHLTAKGKTSRSTDEQRRTNMLWTIVVVLLILWLLGFSLHIAGGLIHILLVVALVVVVINLLSGRRAL
jgi:hypothetical protein